MVHCRICAQELDLESPATSRCGKCDAPFHYVCWVYNDRQCAIFGCEKADTEAEEREVLKESRGWFGTVPMGAAVLTLAGIFVLFFLMMAMRVCENAANS